MAQNITKFREARELTQKDLAALTGLSPDWISMIEQGRVNPTLDVIVELSMGLKVRPAQLLMPPEHDTK